MKLHLLLAFALANFAIAGKHHDKGKPGKGPKQPKPPKPVQCRGKFAHIDAFKYTAAMQPGWNLGNTLDAVPDEGSWNNAPAQAKTFDQVKKAGFKSIRVPVTYTHHFVSEGPEWKVDEKWLQRVSDVLDMVTSRGLYALVNVHHDSWGWMDITKPDANIPEIQAKFYQLWYQIGRKLACKSHMVAFESINEPTANETPEHAAVINSYNEIFLKAIHDAGGWNKKRMVNLVGMHTDSVKTSLYFEKPKKLPNPWALHFHYYSPYDFIFSAWGKTIWGSEADKATMETDFANLRGNFTRTPIVLGEWSGATPVTEPAARWAYWDHLSALSKKYGFTWQIWDNGLDFFNRDTGVWRDETGLEILRNNVKGKKSALPKATTDPNALTQTSSATVFIKLGKDGVTFVQDYPLPLSFNGNKLVSISSAASGPVLPSTAYSVDTATETVTLKASYLGPLLLSNTPGTKDTLTLKFSAGASLRIPVVAWTTPVLSSTSSTAEARDYDFAIPLTWNNGIKKLAAVKAEILEAGEPSGNYLFDDWTRWLSPLQQGRLTYNSHWEFDAENLIVRKAVVDEVLRIGKSVKLTFEFYPRTEGNSVEYVLEAPQA